MPICEYNAPHTHAHTHTQYVGICGYQDENAIDRHSHIFLLTCAKFITSLHSDVIDFKKLYYL